MKEDDEWEVKKNVPQKMRNVNGIYESEWDLDETLWT